MIIKEHIALAPFTSLKVGGNARYFADVNSLEEFHEALDFASSHELNVFLLGGGSNVIISDKGWPGIVIKLSIGGISIVEDSKEYAVVEVGAGESWDDFVAWSVLQNLSGVECLSGIPGTTGSTPIQNVGAYGQEVSETITQVQIWDISAKLFRWIANEECNFSYRNSVFKQNSLGDVVVTKVQFRLKKNHFPELRYGELKREVDKDGINTLAELRNKVIQIRSRKSMVIDEKDINSRSAGSFFTNPIVDQTEFQTFLKRAHEKGFESETIPQFPDKDGKVKLAAGWLIEKSGFSKGYEYKNVGLSEKHALAIINKNGGTAQEVFELAHLIQDGVFQTWGIRLENEPQFIGEFRTD